MINSQKIPCQMQHQKDDERTLNSEKKNGTIVTECYWIFHVALLMPIRSLLVVKSENDKYSFHQDTCFCRFILEKNRVFAYLSFICREATTIFVSVLPTLEICLKKVNSLRVCFPFFNVFKASKVVIVCIGKKRGKAF